MAPSKAHAVIKNGRSVDALIDTATSALHRLRERVTFPEDLMRHVEVHIKRSFQSLTSAAVVDRAREMDALATDLWNASVEVANEHESTDPSLGTLVRVFALMMLDAAHRSSSRRAKNHGQRLRMFKVAIRTARLCLDRDQLDLALLALQKCSEQIPQPSESPSLVEFDEAPRQPRDEDGRDFASLEGQYYLLRILHACKSRRFDLADHFYQNLLSMDLSDCPQASELNLKAADLFHEISNLVDRSEDRAIRMAWIERAFTSLENNGANELGPDVVDAYLSIAAAYVDILLSSAEAPSLARAGEVVASLECVPTLANRVALPILKMRLLSSQPEPEIEELQQTLSHMTKMLVLTEENFKLVMQTLRAAERLDSPSALLVSREFICHRLLSEIAGTSTAAAQVHEWLERASVTHVLIATSRLATFTDVVREEVVDELQEFLDTVATSEARVFTARAVHAMQTLLWQASTRLEGQIADRCSSLLRHVLFRSAGDVNKGRIGRKLLRSAIDRHELSMAREILLEMPIAAQNDPATRYLAFKLALACEDEELAVASLQIIAKTAGKDPNYLYACVLDTQQHQGMRRMAVAALQALVEQRPPGIQFATLLRCTARLLLAGSDLPGHDAETHAAEVIATFELAASRTEELRKLSQERWQMEIEWWSKNSFNLAVRHCGSLDPKMLLRLLEACMTFLDCHSRHSEGVQAQDILKRKVVCLFMSTTASIVLGRGSGSGLNHFTKAREKIGIFKKLNGKLDPYVHDKGTGSRAFAMLKFELECILRLQRWDDVDAVLHECLDARNEGRWDTLADLLIAMNEHLDGTNEQGHTAHLMTQLLQRIINETWRKERDITKVSRWLRFTFTLCLNHSKGDFSLKLLEQASRMAEGGQRGKHEVYPESELQWLSATGFNHAVDLLAAGQNNHAASWMDAALETARWSQDNGSLHAVLTRNRAAANERMRQHAAG